MMIRLHDQHYPYTRRELQADHPLVSIPRNPTPEQLLDLGAAQVMPIDPPAAEPGMRVVEAAPVEVDGIWAQRWEQVPADPEPVPDAVPGHKVVALLMRLGKWPEVAALIAAFPEPQRTLANISLSAPWGRHTPLILAAQQALGWTDDFVDELFRRAPQEPIT